MNDISISCQISSGKIKCRFKQTYSHEKIPKGDLYINIEAWDAGGPVRIGICKKHVAAVFELFEEAMKDLNIRTMTGI